MSIEIRAVIDTNVLVSALWSGDGKAAEIVKLVPAVITPYFSKAIIDEYTEVLNRPKFDFATEKKEKLLSLMEEFGESVSPNKSAIPMPDETDRVFYDTAKASGAILITGNKKDYPDEPFIVTPSVFLSKYIEIE